EPATNRSLAIIKRLPGKTDTRRPKALIVIETAWGAGWYREHRRAVPIRHSSKLARGDAITRANNSVQAIAPFGRVDISIEQHGDRLRRIVSAGIEVCDLIGLCVRRNDVLIAHAQLEAEIAPHSPVIRYKPVILRKAEETDRVV